MKDGGQAFPMSSEEWNEKYPIGIPVYLREDDGTIAETNTKSEAWELGSGHSVIKVSGKSDGYSLDRIMAM